MDRLYLLPVSFHTLSALTLLFYPIIQDLPEELRTKLRTAGLTLEECEENLACTLSILHFLYKRKFKLKKAASVKLDGPVPAEEEGEAFEIAVQAEVLDGPDLPEKSGNASGTQQAISNEITVDDLAREARSITEGDPLTLFTKFVSHGQGYV